MRGGGKAIKNNKIVWDWKKKNLIPTILMGVPMAKKLIICLFQRWNEGFLSLGKTTWPIFCYQIISITIKKTLHKIQRSFRLKDPRLDFLNW